jgi:hypothetical protein
MPLIGADAGEGAVGVLMHQAEPALLVDLVVGGLVLAVARDGQVDAAVVVEVGHAAVDVALVEREAAGEVLVGEGVARVGAAVDQQLAGVGPLAV